MTEDGQYYVEDLSTSEVQASYKHYIFASLKMDTTDSKYTCIKNEDGKVLRLKSGIVNLKTKDVTQNTEYTTDTKRNRVCERKLWCRCSISRNKL